MKDKTAKWPRHGIQDFKFIQEKVLRAKKNLFIWDRVGNASNYFKSMEIYFEMSKPASEHSEITKKDDGEKFCRGLYKAVSSATQ
jgi:hypothetical protein